MKTITCIAGLALLTSTVTHAEMVKPDGWNGGALEGYTKQYYVDFSGTGDFQSHQRGELHIGQTATGDWSLYFQAPFSYVDNSYGPYQAPDWLKGNSGKTREHTFDHLLKSDMLGGRTPLTLHSLLGDIDVSVDYISEVYSNGTLTGFDAEVLSGGDYVKAGSSLGYNLRNVSQSDLNDYAGGGKGKGKGGKEKAPVGTGPLAQSPQSDDFATDSDWIWEVAYELVIDGSLFDDSWLTQTADDFLFTMGDLHASPPKTDSLENNPYAYCRVGLNGTCVTELGGDRDIVTDVNNPVGIALLGAMFIGLSLWRRQAH